MLLKDSLITDPAAAALPPGDGTKAINKSGVFRITDQLAFQTEKRNRNVSEEQ